MAALTPQQIDSLKILDDTFGSHPKLVGAGRSLSDKIRQALPDVDDLTIGRVLLEIGQATAHLVSELEQQTFDTSQAQAVLKPLVGSIACAAIQLTELNWREETP